MIDKPKYNQYRNTVRKKHCKSCGIFITKDLQVRAGVNYINNFCKPCRRTASRENSRKKAQIIKNNPLW
tara:strand:- start:455 stop:661 length:207 start_codon:yes stop_codon:yes gene_type:complete